jgi:hypothetical protein
VQASPRGAGAFARQSRVHLGCFPDYVQRYASKEDLDEDGGKGGDSMSDDGSTSDGFLSSSDEEEDPPAGHAEIS